MQRDVQTSVRRRWLRGAPVAALLVCIVALGCHSAPSDRPSVVVVLVDQLRKDSFDAWSPLLYDLARRGVAFEQMRAAAPWTYPSVISMMSGLYPHQHGPMATADALSSIFSTPTFRWSTGRFAPLATGRRPS